METLRHPAVAGRFYPAERASLIQDLESYLSPSETRKPAIGCIVPHAGYIYSGPVAGAVYANIDVPERCIILCPNHTGRGRPLAIMSSGAWQTPLGSAKIDSDLAAKLKTQFPLLSEDSDAHRSEHAVEVQLPFLQKQQSQLNFVPIALGVRDFEILKALGEVLAKVLRSEDEPVLMIASSDMNHYESDAVTRIKDNKAIERILGLDTRGLYDVVTQQDVSMCGFGPAIVMLTAAKHMGAASAELVKYATSGDVSGDRDMVVGYAGVLVR
ncbi:MAG: AmmeMemoRadiSam system protein B [Acidobacteriaceae bacterium]|nr:AmmeMemoRadiSam system protein B [Acidobacteriaceae bacterium]